MNCRLLVNLATLALKPLLLFFESMWHLNVHRYAMKGLSLKVKTVKGEYFFFFSISATASYLFSFSLSRTCNTFSYEGLFNAQIGDLFNFRENPSGL